MNITKWNINSNYAERCVIAKKMFNKICKIKGDEFALTLLHHEEEFNRRLDLYTGKRQKEALTFKEKEVNIQHKDSYTLNDFINGN